MKSLSLAFGLLLAASVAAAQTPDGKALYEKNCRMCHGADGKANPTMKKMMATLPDLNAKLMGTIADDKLIGVLTSGTANGKMKGFKEKMSAAEIAAVAKYVRGLAK